MGKKLGKVILIADDTLPLRVMLEEVLTEAGYEVITASDGIEAWHLINSRFKELDLVVLDLLMPKMSGFEILSRLKQEFPQRRFPVLALSGIFKSDKEMIKLKEMGANGYLNKTSVIDEILYRVNTLFCTYVSQARRYPRVLYSLPVDYQSDTAKYSSYTTTISIGGCFIRTLKPAPKDAILTLSLEIPSCECKEIIRLQSRVAWFNDYYLDFKPNAPPGMGIEFKELSEEALECLKELVEMKLREEEIWKSLPG